MSEDNKATLRAVIFVFILSLILSCSKDEPIETPCYTCIEEMEWLQIIEINGVESVIWVWEIIRITDYCDKTADEIRLIEINTPKRKIQCYQNN
jgi:hypothetical protein